MMRMFGRTQRQETTQDILPPFKYPTTGIQWEEVTNINDLKPGDHICYDKLPYYHHAIVETVFRQAQSVRCIGWSLVNPTEIIRIDLKLEIGCGYMVYRAIYTKGCYSNEEVLKRAQARLGETEYHWMWNFARAFPKWCKTGRGSLTHSDSEADDRYIRAVMAELK